MLRGYARAVDRLALRSHAENLAAVDAQLPINCAIYVFRTMQIAEILPCYLPLWTPRLFFGEGFFVMAEITRKVETFNLAFRLAWNRISDDQKRKQPNIAQRLD